MHPRKIPVACVQANAHDRSQFAAAWPRLVATANDAARAGAKLIVLPEGSVPGYVLGRTPVDEAELERAAQDLATLARTHGATVVYGGAKRAGGRTFNAAIVVGPSGAELGYSAKQFLWHFDRHWFTAGTHLEPIDTPAGRLGVLVCADGRIPSIAATLVERGAELLVMPTAWVTSGRDPLARENVQADLMANVRARENGVPFVVANKCGVELPSVAYCGKSAIIDATGAFVARGDEREPGIVAGEIELGTPSVRPPAPLATSGGPRADGPRALRVAFAFADGAEADRFATLAAQADAQALLAYADGAAAGAGARPSPGDDALARIDLRPEDAGRVRASAGLRFGVVDDATIRSPRGLVPARLAGIDLFVWLARGDDGWDVRVARTRAAELRAYVVVFDRASRRAFAVDPDGVVVAGTFDDYRIATVVVDPARTAATLVAPGTDVLAGLRTAEAIRAESAALV